MVQVVSEWYRMQWRYPQAESGRILVGWVNIEQSYMLWTLSNAEGHVDNRRPKSESGENGAKGQPKRDQVDVVMMQYCHV